MLPEVEEYFRIADRTAEETTAAHRALERDDPYGSRRVSDPLPTEEEVAAHRARRQEVADRANNGFAKAREALRASDDPLVKWLASNQEVWSYRTHVEIVLKALPASLAELNRLSANKGWCNVWVNLRTQAIADGAIEDNRTDLEKIREAAVEKLSHCCIEPEDAGEIFDDLVREVRAQYEGSPAPTGTLTPDSPEN